MKAWQLLVLPIDAHHQTHTYLEAGQSATGSIGRWQRSVEVVVAQVKDRECWEAAVGAVARWERSCALERCIEAGFAWLDVIVTGTLLGLLNAGQNSLYLAWCDHAWVWAWEPT